MNMIRHGPAPSDRAASMYSFSLIDSTWPRTMPADRRPAEEPEHDDHDRQAGADEPKIGFCTATENSAIANSRNGTDSSKSMNRARTESTMPPK